MFNQLHLPAESTQLSKKTLAEARLKIQRGEVPRPQGIDVEIKTEQAVGDVQHDFVTLIRTPGPCNKLVWSEPDGSLHKRPAELIVDGTATTYPIRDIDAMAELLSWLSSQTDVVLVLGYIPGTEDGEPYRIASQRRLAEMLGVDEKDCPAGLQMINGDRYATRTKANFHPSTWLLFDYDKVPSMPSSLVYDDPLSWWAAMIDLLPSLYGVGYILTPSTTSRVQRDGKTAFAGGGWHAYVQVQDAVDVERFGRELLIRAMATPYGFMRQIHSRKTGEVIGHRPWMLCDPTTFAAERLVFDGRPIVQGDGLAVAPISLSTTPGGRLDTSALVLDEDTAARVAKQTGYKIKREHIGSVMLINDRDLRLDIPIETKAGSMTVREYWRSDHGKLRAQATFRPDSQSWAAYLNRHADGTPFLYDVGSQTKFVLPMDERRAYVREAVDKLDHGNTPAVEKVVALIPGCSLTPVEADGLMRKVKQTTGIGLSVLRDQLAACPNGIPQPASHPELAAIVIRRVPGLLYTQSSFWQWNQPYRGKWTAVDDRTIRKVVQGVCDERQDGIYTKGDVDSITDMVKTELFSEGQEFDAARHIINLASGELSMVNGIWVHGPHVAEHFCTTQLPLEYDPNVQAPRFEQFLGEIFDGDADHAQKRQLLLEAIGYTLLPTCRFEAFFLLIGSGANGKSVLLSVIESLLGRDHVCAVQPSQFDNRFQRAHLRGKLANIVTEIAEGAQIADAELKAMVSGELTTAEFKLKPAFDFHPFATMWFGTNHMPHTRDFSDALFRRARILTFNNKFDGEACDPRLADKLKAELPGILNLALDAVKGVFSRGAFTECPSDREARLGWRLEADQVAQFVEDEIVIDPAGQVPSADVYRRYRRWAEDGGIHRMMAHRGFTDRLTRLGFKTTRTGSKRMIAGLRFKPVELPEGSRAYPVTQGDACDTGFYITPMEKKE